MQSYEIFLSPPNHLDLFRSLSESLDLIRSRGTHTQKELFLRQKLRKIIEKTDQLAGVLAVIINQNNQSVNENLQQPVCSVSHSITDELIKLADLREKGILTEDEFKQQKAKLLYKEER